MRLAAKYLSSFARDVKRLRKKHVNLKPLCEVIELVQRNEEEMMKVRNLGRKSLEEVQQKLVGLGLSLRHNED